MHRELRAAILGVAVALARAQIAVELRQWRGTGDPAPAIGTAAAVIASAADTEAAFDLSLLRLFGDYWAELVPADGTPPHVGPEGRDPATLDELRDQAGHLTAAAPDSRRAARAALHAGLIADNLRGERAGPRSSSPRRWHSPSKRCWPNWPPKKATKPERVRSPAKSAAGPPRSAWPRWSPKPRPSILASENAPTILGLR